MWTRKEFRLFRLNLRSFLVLGLLGLCGIVSLASCDRGGSQVEALKQEVKSLQEEMARLKDQVGQLEEARRQAPKPAEAAAVARVLSAPQPTPMPAAEPALTVEQLLKQKEQLLGGKVTVEGRMGLVMIHRKSLYLKGQQAMVEVFFADLPDKNLVQRLISQDWPGKVVVTGVFAPSGHERTGFQITAESIELL